MRRTVKLVAKKFSIFASRPLRLRKIVASAIALLVLMSLEITTIFVGSTPALASAIFTSSDQDQSISSFISAFYDPTNHFFYTDTQNHAEADFWTEAIDWGIVMDAYNRTKNTTYNQMIGDIYNHATSVYGANCGQWQVPNANNQTLALWAEASLQAYTITNNTTYRDCAKALFDKIYQSWDTTVESGGIWTTSTTPQTTKTMATNALAVMTAAQLSTILGDTTYLTDAQNIYNWIRAHLTNLTGTSGAVYDRYDSTSNTIIMDQFSYNYGTFIGAALALYDATKSNTASTTNQPVNYLADANNVANASLTNVTINGDGVIQYESDCNNHSSSGDTSNSISGNNGNIANDGSFVTENNTCTGGTDERALYKAVYVHYLADLAFNSNNAVSESAAYGQVLDENAAIAWSDRRPTDGLMGPDWAEPAPTGPIRSWEAATGVEIFQVLPNNNNIGTYQSQDATLQGGLSLATQYTGYLSNSGYISSWNQQGQTVSFTVTAPAAGTNLLILRYSAGAGTADRYLQVNGSQNTANFPTGPIYASGSSNSVVAQISFPGTNTWNAYDLAVIPALLNQGNNTISITFDSSQNSRNWLNLDQLTVAPGFPPPPVSNSPSVATPTLTPTVSATITNVVPNVVNNTASPGNNQGKSGNGTVSGGSNAGKVGNNTPTPTVHTPTPTPTTHTPTPTVTVTAIATPKATATSVPTQTATATSLPTQTATATPKATATSVPTQTATATPVPTQTATATSLPTQTATSVPTQTATATPVPTQIATATSIPTQTATATPKATVTLIPTQTMTATSVPTQTATATSVPTQTTTAT